MDGGIINITDLRDALLHIEREDRVPKGQKNLAHHLGISSGSLNKLVNGNAEFSNELFLKCNEATSGKYRDLLLNFVGQAARSRKKESVNAKKGCSAKFIVAKVVEIECDDTSDLEHVDRLLELAFQKAVKYQLVEERKTGLPPNQEPK